MTYKIVQPPTPKHICDLPPTPFWKKSKFEGMVVECECGRKWQWFHYPVEGGWGWTAAYNPEVEQR